jgi:putative flippase GtrA
VRFVQWLPPRWRATAVEVATFAGIGAVNTVVNLAIFNLLLSIGPLKANVIATVVATTSSYFMNRYWTYRLLPKASLRREYTLFFMFNVVGLLIESAFLFVARYGMHFDERTDIVEFNIAKFSGLALGTVFRFWAYRRFVFKASGITTMSSTAVPAVSRASETGDHADGPR